MTRSRTHIGMVLLCLILMGCDKDDPAADDVTLTGTFTSVDGMTDIATSPVLAFDSDGSPHIAYRDVISNELRYATQSHDGTWQIESIDMTDGFSISLVLSPANIPYVTFQKYTDDLESELWLASRPGTQWHLECIDRTGGVIGPWSSIALSPAGEPSVAYFIGYPSYDLRFAERFESQWNAITIHSEGGTGYGARLLFDGQGNPIISHGDVSNNALLLSRRSNSDWSTEVLRTDQQVGPHLAMSLTRTSDVYIAHRSGVSPTALALTTIEQGTSRMVTVDAEGDVGYEPSLALDPGGHPWIAYRGGRDRLTIAFEQDQTWRTVDIEAAGIGITHASIAFDPAGRLGVAVAPSHEAGVLFGWIDKVPLTIDSSSPVNP